MKNKEKIAKVMLPAEDDKVDSLISDVFILSSMNLLAEDLSDRKLNKKVTDFLEKTAEEFGERDLEEESKVEFFCERCRKYLPLSEQSENVLDLCKNCYEKQKEEEEYED